MSITSIDAHKLHIELTAIVDSYTFFVYLTVQVEGTRFGDNFFDLEPHERRVIRVTDPKTELTADLVTVGSS